jgi:hypothetical protein
MQDHDLSRHYRHAVTVTLGEHLSERELPTAIQMAGSFDLAAATGTISFIGALAHRFGIADDVRRRLCLELYSALQRPVARFDEAAVSAMPVPPREPESVLAPREETIPRNPMPPALQVFMALALAINREVMAKGHNAHLDFSEAFAELKGQSRFRDAALLANWPTQEPNTEITSTLTEQDLSALFHLLYMALCEALGPVKADKTLQAVIAEVEQHPAAREFSPRRLL